MSHPAPPAALWLWAELAPSRCPSLEQVSTGNRAQPSQGYSPGSRKWGQGQGHSPLEDRSFGSQDPSNPGLGCTGAISARLGMLRSAWASERARSSPQSHSQPWASLEQDGSTSLSAPGLCLPLRNEQPLAGLGQAEFGTLSLEGCCLQPLHLVSMLCCALAAWGSVQHLALGAQGERGQQKGGQCWGRGFMSPGALPSVFSSPWEG